MGKHDSEEESYFHQKRPNYSKISKWTKSKLIKLVTEKNYKISSAAKILKINESTAKMIVRKFHQWDQIRRQVFLADAQKEKQIKIRKTSTSGIPTASLKIEEQVLYPYMLLQVFPVYPIQFFPQI